MNEEIERFLEKIKTDPQLREKVGSMQTAAEFVKEAVQRGFNFSENDLTNAEAEVKSKKSGELGACICFWAGGGNEASDIKGTPEYDCACFEVGDGYYKKDGKTACDCLLGGVGYPGWG